MSEPRKVYAAINAVSAALAKDGIGKTRKNDQQGYKFRGIDEVFNALAPLLAEHKLLILPRMLARSVTERLTKNGGVLFYVLVDAEYDFVSAVDGSCHVVRTFGEAMDSGDKATNKAMSAAYKYAAFQAFCIPTEGDNDADKTTHEVAAKPPEGFEDWILDLELVAKEHGIKPLEVAWKASKADYRKFLTETNKAGWEALKALAATTTKTLAEADKSLASATRTTQGAR